jgi:thiol-disulfide isomerase/thioredoxin
MSNCHKSNTSLFGSLMLCLMICLPSISLSQGKITKKKFVEKISRAEATYVVFGAGWCKPCVRLKKLLKDAEIAHKIVFLDSSDIWVQKMLLKLEYPGIPYTVVYQNGKATGVVRMGTGPSLIFLIANVDPD